VREFLVSRGDPSSSTQAPLGFGLVDELAHVAAVAEH